MAFYNAATNLPRTPDAFIMNATLPSIRRPSDLINSWSSSWRPTKQDPLLTPPMSSNFQSRVLVHHTHPIVVEEDDDAAEGMKLPPIRHLERLSSHLPPLTPPEDLPHIARLPSPQTLESEDFFQSKPMALEQESPCVVDWLDFTRTRSAHFIAEKTCEMICYLWFSSNPSNSSTDGSPPFHARGSTPSPLQLVASPPFVLFMQKLLETTQVSQSVIVLSLHFIYRLKERNRCTPAQRGSEFRIAVAGLMMANKFLDDNTYTNKTWSEVSGIELEEINRMEREFLLGVDFNLYVDKATYGSWLNLLKGLVMAKERDTRQYRKSSRVAKESRITSSHHHPSSTGPASRTYSPSSGRQRGPVHRHRARSSSPTSRTMTMSSSRLATYVSHAAPPPPPPPVITSQYTASPVRSGAKRTAQDAFSPTSASFTHVPSKRPVSIALQIPEYKPSGSLSSGGNSNSPLEGLQSFSTMSLSTASGMHSPLEETTITDINGTRSSNGRSAVPETLVAAYALDEGRKSTVPQNLYFYSLAGSPTGEVSPSQESRARKARLRYHQPTAPSTYSYADLNACANGALYAPQANGAPSVSTQKPRYLHSDPRAMAMTPMPTVVQSASTSPAMGLPYAPTTLPHFRDDVWARPPVPAAAPSSSNVNLQPSAYAYSRPNQESSVSTQPDARMYSTDGHPLDYPPTNNRGSIHPASDSAQHHQRVPSAPFANNGPPGVGAQFYPTPVQSSSYPHSHAHNPRHVNINGAYPWVRTRY